MEGPAGKIRITDHPDHSCNFRVRSLTGNDHISCRPQKVVKTAQVCRVRGRITAGGARKGVCKPGRLLFMHGIAGQMAQKDEVYEHHGVAGGKCTIVNLFFPGNEHFALIRYGKKSAASGIGKMPVAIAGETQRFLKPCRVGTGLVEPDQRMDHKCIIIAKGRNCCLAIAIAVQEPAIGQP